MNENILNIILAVIGLLSAIITGVAIPYLKSKTDIAKQEKIFSSIEFAVMAAEQTLKLTDPYGTKRKAFVLNYLNSKNINISDMDIDVLIEAAVLNLNIIKEELKARE